MRKHFLELPIHLLLLRDPLYCRVWGGRYCIYPWQLAFAHASLSPSSSGLFGKAKRNRDGHRGSVAKNMQYLPPHMRQYTTPTFCLIIMSCRTRLWGIFRSVTDPFDDFLRPELRKLWRKFRSVFRKSQMVIPNSPGAEVWYSNGCGWIRIQKTSQKNMNTISIWQMIKNHNWNLFFLTKIDNCTWLEPQKKWQSTYWCGVFICKSVKSMNSSPPPTRLIVVHSGGLDAVRLEEFLEILRDDCGGQVGDVDADCLVERHWKETNREVSWKDCQEKHIIVLLVQKYTNQFH